MEQYYKIAGLVVKMESFGRTAEQAKQYLCETCDHVDIRLSTELLRKQWPGWETELQALSEEDREYFVSGVLFFRKLLQFSGFMLHSSAVVVDGKAYLFTADSGTGKSTHTQLWKQVFGDRAYILNDDKPAVRLEDGIWYAYGNPWSGKHDISANTKAPIAGITVLQRGEENEILPFVGKDAVLAIMRQVSRPKRPDEQLKLMQLLNQLLTQIPVWKLRCNMEPQAAVLSYEAMSGKKFF